MYKICIKTLKSHNYLYINILFIFRQYTKNSFSFVSIEIEILWSRAQLALAQSNFYEFTFYIESTLENCQQALRCKTGSYIYIYNYLNLYKKENNFPKIIDIIHILKFHL